MDLGGAAGGRGSGLAALWPAAPDAAAPGRSPQGHSGGRPVVQVGALRARGGQGRALWGDLPLQGFLCSCWRAGSTLGRKERTDGTLLFIQSQGPPQAPAALEIIQAGGLLGGLPGVGGLLLVVTRLASPSATDPAR